MKAIVKTRDINGGVEIMVEGRIDATNYETFESVAKSVIEKGYPLVVVNLENIAYLGSSGIRTLIFLKNELNDKNGRLFLLKPSPMAQKVLKAVGIYDYFTIVSSIDEIK